MKGMGKFITVYLINNMNRFGCEISFLLMHNVNVQREPTIIAKKYSAHFSTVRMLTVLSSCPKLSKGLPRCPVRF